MPNYQFGQSSPAFTNIPVPIGRSFTFAAAGETQGAIFILQWFDGVNWVPYNLDFSGLTLVPSTPLTAILHNYGSVNQVRMFISFPTSNTSVRVVLNVIPIERALM